MIYGLGAALGWGLSDFMVALVARRIGSFTTVLIGQGAGLALFTIFLLAGAGHLPRWHPGLLVLPVIGISGALSYMAFYRALQLGPIALVSPIAAGYAAIVIGLSLTILRETIPGLALAGAGVIIVGVVLASTDVRAMRAERAAGRSGLFYAVLAMVGFGVGAFLIAHYAQDVGWFGAIYLSRLGSAATLVVVLLVRSRPPTAGMRSSIVGWASMLGLLDIMGYASFARGSELGLVSITAAASVTYPLIPILFGVFYFRERPAATQWIGVAAVGGGLALLAFGR